MELRLVMPNMIIPNPIALYGSAGPRLLCEWLSGQAGKTKDPAGWLVCFPTLAAMKLRQGWGAPSPLVIAVPVG
jgi:hypothetical protein